MLDNRLASESSGRTSLKITFYSILVFVIMAIYILVLNEDRLKDSNVTKFKKTDLVSLINDFDRTKVEAKENTKSVITTPKIELDTDIYHLNNNWMYNVNLMQFSSYIIIKDDKNRNLEGMVYVNADPRDSDLRCLIYSNGMDKPIVLKVKTMYKLAVFYVRKIICEFEDIPGFSLNELVTAIVFENDFNYDLSQPSRFTKDIINYQIPQIIEVQEPRIKDVGICLQFVSRVYPGIYNWVKLHQDFKAAELVMYDGSHDKSLRKLLSKSFQKPFTDIYDYNTAENDICNNKIILSYKTKFTSIFTDYRRKCSATYQSTLARSYDGNHNHLSANDCYIKLNYKYEFVTLYDLDELIIPRYYDGSKIIETSANNVCTNRSHVCTIKPIFLSMYDYFVKLINKSFHHDSSKLRSIQFSHAAYLIPTEMSKNVLNQVKDFAQKFETNSYNGGFPAKVAISNHEMLIKEEDKNHVIKLNKFYDAYLCYYENYLKKIENFDGNMLRYLYFMTGPGKRLAKSIHYTKNVFSLFTHDAIHFEKDSFIFGKKNHKIITCFIFFIFKMHLGLIHM
jgi:hypothetical protein